MDGRKFPTYDLAAFCVTAMSTRLNELWMGGGWVDEENSESGCKTINIHQNRNDICTNPTTFLIKIKTFISGVTTKIRIKETTKRKHIWFYKYKSDSTIL